MRLATREALLSFRRAPLLSALSVTTIAFGAAQMQVARATLVADADGERRATVLVPAGTTAVLRGADGQDTALASGAMRATELIFATYESSRSHRRIDLPLQSTDSALASLLGK